MSPDHHRLHVEVHQRRDHRVFEARHRDEVVAELVLRTAQPPQLLPQLVLLAGLHLAHDQDLEVGPRGWACRSLPGFGGTISGHPLQPGPIRPADQRPVQLGGTRRERLRVAEAM